MFLQRHVFTFLRDDGHDLIIHLLLERHVTYVIKHTQQVRLKQIKSTLFKSDTKIHRKTKKNDKNLLTTETVTLSTDNNRLLSIALIVSSVIFNVWQQFQFQQQQVPKETHYT